MSADPAIVTGGAAGIGKATTVLLLRSGHPVGVLDNNPDRLRDLAEWATVHDFPLTCYVTDMSRESQVKEATDAFFVRWGGPRYLVNCAGVSAYGTLTSLSADDWHRAFHVNVDGVFYASKYAIPHMIREGGGAIVNLSSVHGWASQRNVVAYAATKGAIIAMTRAMAADYGDIPIRVNAVCPGSIRTPMLDRCAELERPEDPAGALEEWGGRHLLGRIGTADEVADLVCWLLLHGTFVTGAIIPVDGGLTARLP